MMLKTYCALQRICLNDTDFVQAEIFHFLDEVLAEMIFLSKVLHS